MSRVTCRKGRRPETVSAENRLTYRIYEIGLLGGYCNEYSFFKAATLASENLKTTNEFRLLAMPVEPKIPPRSIKLAANHLRNYFLPEKYGNSFKIKRLKTYEFQP